MSTDCVACGACCAYFRVSFYWAESSDHPHGTTPAHLTTPISPYHLAMRGTDRVPPRCIALDGKIGDAVACTIYEQRPSPCREFTAGEVRCTEARAKHSLPPLLSSAG